MCTWFSLDTIVSKDQTDPFQRIYSVAPTYAHTRPINQNLRVNARSETISIVLNA